MFSLSRWPLFLCHLTSFLLERGTESALGASVKLSSRLSHLVHTPCLTDDDASWAFLKQRCPDGTESADRATCRLARDQGLLGTRHLQ